MPRHYRRPFVLSRRQFLTALSCLTATKARTDACSQVRSFNDLGIQEFHFATLQSFQTPNLEFFVRNHFERVVLGESTWKLRVTGAVRNPLEITYHDLLELPIRALTVTLECAGNWVGGGGVSTATWTGLPLGKLLENAGL